MSNFEGKPNIKVICIFEAPYIIGKTMATFNCHSNKFKPDDREKSNSYMICIKCELWIVELIRHVVCQCPFNNLGEE